MHSIEKSIHRNIVKAFPKGLERVAPSLQIGVVQNGKKLAQLQFGQEYKYFDLASLTKILFSSSYLMHLVSQNTINWADRLSWFLPELDHKNISFKQVLTHTAGLASWHPYYKSLISLSEKEKWPWLLEKINQEKILKGPHKSLYSDLDFMLIALSLMALQEKSLLHCWRDLKKHYSPSRLHFCVNNKAKYTPSEYAPTENCKWRKRRLQGEVHDDNTW
ncbi:MAG: serine hydrolase domain-containing protein, partial [Bdellovibrionales bacterium]